MEFTNIGKKDKYMSLALPMLIVWRKISQNSDIFEIMQVFAIKNKKIKTKKQQQPKLEKGINEHKNVGFSGRLEKQIFCC